MLFYTTLLPTSKFELSLFTAHCNCFLKFSRSLAMHVVYYLGYIVFNIQLQMDLKSSLSFIPHTLVIPHYHL